MRGRYVPDEIIVKLRVSTADETGSADAVLARDRSHIVRGLEQGRIREIRPLLKDFERQQGKLRAWRDGRRTPVTLSERRLLRRRQRTRRGPAETDLGRLYRIRIDAQGEVGLEETLETLRRVPGVEYAERNWIVSICAEPNDPLYGSQWALAKIGAAQAWETCRGSTDVVVALPDTGVDYHHRDLQANMWVNEAELNGVAGVDDDGNGYIDDIRGYDFVAGDDDPIDDGGHGTHCAGIIAAQADNGLDVAGLCWNARIMPLKMLDDEGFGSVSEAVEAIYYAVANGAEVISCSWGEAEDSRALKDAVAYAYSEGVVLVAAAGNDHSSEPFYPAGYPEVISVAATQENDQRLYASNFGDRVDVAAPGDEILSLRAAGTSAGAAWDTFTTKLSGTSMAAPHVAGACALLLCANPFLGPDDVRQAILSTGDPIATGICLSNGRLNVAGAMQAAVPLRGVVGFNREAYPEGSDILIHLADGHLKGAESQTVTVTTDGGDVETVILSETTLAVGVLSAVLGSENGLAAPGDGRVQVQDAEWVTVQYLDADNGMGRTDQWATSRARADYTPPAVLDVEIEPRGSLMRLTVTTSEPTQMEIRYASAGDSAASSSLRDPVSQGRHRVNLGPLRHGLDYGFAITLTDAAGNELVADRDNLGQVFSVQVDPNALLVPDTYRTIQAAIDDARPGDTVWVADGTYSGPGNTMIDFEGNAIAVRSENGPEACIINGRRRSRVVVFRNNEDANSILDGFTITNGGRTDFGAGIQCLAGAPTIMNCILTDNSANVGGGGIYCSTSSPTIQTCAFIGNDADERGGGLYSEAGGNPAVVGCTFTDNWARAGGAASGAYDSHSLFRQCLFFDNTAQTDGGAIASFGAAVTLANCTIVGNEAGSLGGGIRCEAPGSFRLDNCILWDNADDNGESDVEVMQIAAHYFEVEANYSCVQGWTGTCAGVGSFSLDPLFADPENGDFHLRSQGGRWDSEQAQWTYDAETSPCIDAGDPAWPLGDESLTVPDDPTSTQTINTRINTGAYGGTVEASLALLD